MTNSQLLNKITEPKSGEYDNIFDLAGTVNMSGTLNLTGTVTDNSVSSAVQTVVNTVTLAEINAGKTILAGITGKTINPTNFRVLDSGNFATGTSIEIEDTNGTPVVIASIATAGLTDGAVILPDEANTTVGAGFLGSLTAGAGIAVTKTGSDFTGGTSITVAVDYYLS